MANRACTLPTMENKSHALAAGAFVLTVTALLIALGAWLMRDTAEQRQFEISSKDGVTGLQPQAGVRYKGVLVGRVTSIGLDPQARGHVLVRIAVSENAPITRTTYASLGFQGVTGLAFVQLDDAAEGSPELTAEGGQPARIPMRQGMLSRLTEQGGNLLGQLEQASQRMNALLAQDNQKQLMVAVAQMGQAASSISLLAQRTQQIMAGQGGEGSPSLPQMAAQAEATLKSIQATSERLNGSAEAVRNSATEFRRMSVRMNEPGGTLDRIARSTDALVATSQTLNASLMPRLNRAADDTARTVRQVGRVVESVGDNPQSLLLGRGTLPPGPGEPGFVAPASPQPAAPSR